MKQNRSLQIGKKQQGFAVLFVSAVLLIAATMLSFLLSGAVVSFQRNVGNEYRVEQSFNAAQAGLEYTIAYLDTNYDTLTDGETLTASLSDGSSYSSVIMFQGNKNLIKIVSTGTSADSTSTHAVSQLVSYVEEETGEAAVTNPVIAQGNVELASNSIVTNLASDSTITTAGTVSLSGNAKTVLASGNASTAGNLGSDITQNDSGTGATTSTDLQNNILNGLITDYTITPDAVYNNSSNYDYSTELNGVQGQSIQINQNGTLASLNGASTTTLGSPNNPVVLYVDGNLEIGGDTIIYGEIYTTGNVTLNQNATVYGDIKGEGNIVLESNSQVYGNVTVLGDVHLDSNAIVNGLVFSLGDDGISLDSYAEINGAAVMKGKLIMKSNSHISYDATNILSGNTVTGESAYAKVPGSWNDLNQ